MLQPLFTKYGTTDPIATPFIITDFDLSRQSNVAFHILGDDYKVASFGNKVSVKRINGILRNPETYLVDTIDFYKNVYIGNNYGEPINFSYRNYSGDGYCVGMSISVREGSPASVSIDFLEIERHDVGNASQIDMIKEREDIYEKGEDCRVMLYVPHDENNVAGSLASSLQLSFSSRHSIANSRKNIIYYGDNPTQASLEFVLSDTDGNYSTKYNAMLENLRIKMTPEVHLLIGYDIYPATIVQVSSIDQSNNANYLSYSVSAILGV